MAGFLRGSSPRVRVAAFAAVAVVVLLSLAGLLLFLQAGAAVRGLASALSPHASIVHGGARVDLGGDLLVRDVRIVPNSNPRAALVAREARIRVPGPVWLLRATLGGGDTPPPFERLIVRLEGVTYEGSGELLPGTAYVGWTAGAPFEAAGCGALTHLTPADLTSMGLRTGPARLVIDYLASDDTHGELNLWLEVPGSSRFQHTRFLELPSATEPFSAKPGDTRLREATWGVHDDGFVAARNRWCAQRQRVTRNLVVQGHVDRIEAALERHGVMVERDVAEAYRRYAARGGEFKLLLRPSQPVAFDALSRENWIVRAQRLSPSLIVGGRGALPIVLRPVQADDFVGPPELPKVAPVAVASGSAAPTSVAAPATGPGSTPSATPAGAATASAIDASPRVPAPSNDTTAGSAPGATADSAAAASPVAATATTGATTTTGAPRPTSASTPTVDSVPTAAATPTPAPGASNAIRRDATPSSAKPATTTVATRTPPPLKLGVVKYRDLAGAVDRPVVIHTVFNSRRTGVLRDYNNEAVTLEIPERGGTMLVTLPRATVVRAEVTSAQRIPKSESPNDAQKN